MKGETITISTKSGPLSISAHWAGQTLAVHPPVKDGSATVTRGQWVITHKGCGLSAGTLLCSKARAVEVAKAWDSRFASIDPENARQWEHGKQWGELLYSINTPGYCAPVEPAEDQSSQDTALLLAVKAGLAIDQAGGSKRIRWRGEYWAAPTDAELDYWTFDSCCETPDGRTVEPDHPESWLRILRLV